MKRYLLILLLPLALCACPGNTKSDQSVYDTCNAFGDAEPAVAAAIRAGIIQPAQFPKVNDAIALAKPICGAVPEPTALDPQVYAQLVAAVADIVAANKSIKGH